MKKVLSIFLMTLYFSILFSNTAYAVVNLNTAKQSELESLKGIGPVKAQAIIKYRQKNGNFKTIKDLDKVPGFGPATVKKLQSTVSVKQESSEAKLFSREFKEIKTKPVKRKIKESN